MMGIRKGRCLAINGLFLDHPHTGTGVYTREVLARLLPPARERGAYTVAKVTDDWRYALIGHPEHAREFAHRVPYLRTRAPLRGHAASVEKLLWEQLTLPLAVARLRADLLYSPYFSLPFVVGARTVVTIHDLIPLLLPEYAPSPAFEAYFRLVSAATRHADAVVTDSQCSADDIARRLEVPPDRVHVVYLGVDARYGAAISSAQVHELRARLKLPDRFILYLGGSDPRKNLGVLLRAIHVARQRGDRPPALLLATTKGGRFGDPRDEAARLGLASPHVMFLDGVAEADKPTLYAAAHAFVFPSRYEGFGLPPLEAMASGTPVLCSSSSSLPEVVGDSGLLLDHDDVEAWASAMTRIGEDDALHCLLSQAGRKRAATFTWEQTVDGLRRVFRHVLPGASAVDARQAWQ